MYLIRMLYTSRRLWQHFCRVQWGNYIANKNTKKNWIKCISHFRSHFIFLQWSSRACIAIFRCDKYERSNAESSFLSEYIAWSFTIHSTGKFYPSIFSFFGLNMRWKTNERIYLIFIEMWFSFDDFSFSQLIYHFCFSLFLVACFSLVVNRNFGGSTFGRVCNKKCALLKFWPPFCSQHYHLYLKRHNPNTKLSFCQRSSKFFDFFFF